MSLFSRIGRRTKSLIMTFEQEYIKVQQKQNFSVELHKFHLSLNAIDVIDGIDGYMTLEQPFNLFLCRIPTNK